MQEYSGDKVKMQNKIKQYAPVLVTVYDRPNHFKQCIESLLKNPGVSETTLFISSDGPKDSLSIERVASVRDYIKSISGFKRVIPFTPKENTGSAVMFEVIYRLQEFSDRYIISEDDNIFSPFFLNYINSALDIYENDERIRAISGFMYPGFPSSKLQPILIRAFAGWGTGYWRDKDIPFDLDEKKIAQNIFLDPELFNKINYGLPSIPSMLKVIAEGKLIAGDVIRSAVLFKYDWYCVFPSMSMVRNIGNDGTGQHCGVNDTFFNQEISQTEMIFDGYTHLEFDSFCQKWIIKYYGGKSAIMRNKLIFLEMNSSSKLLRDSWHLVYLLSGFLYREFSALKSFIRQKFSV